MSKIKLLLDVVSDMRSLADSIQAVAEVMAGNEPVKKEEPTTSTKESEPKKTEKQKKKEITLEEVRAKLAEKSQAGLTAQVREIIEKYGGSKLSEVVPKHYADMLKDAEVLGNE
ncbi:MAG: rRNA biogenesis protein rrp5 [Candidatus Pristimantibacillus lignocellulolyticus]|uniref:rRNA biogenesis protein rrp5 n=1 Tax=Candidatus Pristimantibacillus lignocellulolyticus TaxID=2994561 RepID=A0A9J6ZKL7_9BACL|nr:MAG: rRNA biogenesis protein rrp5 [Candidatus Pristimantibacillus lignocellulolyticus]